MTDVNPAAVAQADADSAKAVALAGVELRELTDIAALNALADLFVHIWGADVPLVSGDLLRAMSKAGSYVVGAYVDGRLVGGCIGFHEAPEARALHSHVAGVLPGLIGRSVGFALKLHQRAWALHRGITAIEWTYDPLVARNAYFNIVKLGARPAEYLTNFYGPMNDTINGVDDSDRILIRWELLAPAAVAACQGARLPAAVASAAARRVAVPEDIEALRAADLAAARGWRTRVREQLAPLMGDGWTVTGFDRGEGYLLEPPHHPTNGDPR
jgi:predicted GNAT superfamily acetyltransferase